jgi:AraC-like DNA-binding protein
LKALSENMNVHSTAVEMRVRLDAGSRIAAAVYAPMPPSAAGRQKLEMSMAAVRNVIALVSGQPGFAPVAVRLACAAPADTGPQRRFFRSPVQYDAEETALLFRADLLALPTAIHDPAIAPLVRRYLAELPAQFGDDIIATTRSLIGTLLSSGRCTREAVAECLNLHPRTFQRRLEARGATFSRLLDEHRHALALDLLGRGTSSLAQVADMLGFADQSAFNQAFRRWTDDTPGAVARALGRRQLHPAQAGPDSRVQGR